MIAFTRRRMLARLSCALLPAWTGTRAMAGAVPGAQEMLRVATMDLPPYGWVDEKGAKQGVEYELAEQLAIRSGFRYTNEIMPFARMLQALKEGKVDLLSSQAHQQALDAGEQLAVIHTNNVLVATKKDAGIKTLEDLRGKTFVYHRAASYKQLEGVPGHIERVNSYEQALNMLHSRQGV
ncbi:MAG TPA: transporter substrate-binding domain-containing protein, partial [Burkholderiaceae bacterium]|nr:transporter substrate-binding domain-containing protein [Burkholderiaceae bacterium]